MIDINYSNIDFDSHEYAQSKQKADLAKKKIIELIKQQDPKYRILDCGKSISQINDFSKYTTKIQSEFDDLIFIGMGGAILNPQSLLNLTDHPQKIKIHFVDNTDPIYLTKIFNKINLTKTAIVTVSNSGQTLETIAILGAVIKHFQDNNIANFDQRCFFITTTQNNKLTEIANELSAIIIPHEENISGRFSGLTNVTTFIASIVGLDTKSYLLGAQKAIDEFMTSDSLDLFENSFMIEDLKEAKERPEPQRTFVGEDSSTESTYKSSAEVSFRRGLFSVISAAALYASKKSIIINLGYLQQFSSYLEWYCQIIAESTGKNNKGFSPFKGLGPNDQHSMLQLYLDGPDDKFYNMFYVKNIPNQHALTSLLPFQYLANFDLSKINDINFTATQKALEDTKRPIRSILLQDLSPQTIGYLTANLMLEVIILCEMMEVNPFNQPGVELIKTHTKKLIK